MTPESKSREWSYERHTRHEQEITKTASLPTCYNAPNTVDNWRHLRLREGLIPLLNYDPGASWMTIGDGNYGSDAYYLIQHGADATATSLTDTTLAVASEKGFIQHFQAQNAECLGAADGSTDYTLCKEAYHHFPRPAVAFYEMARVSRKAVILIEPAESHGRILNHLKRWIKNKLRGDTEFEFEKCGNYIFRLSVREMEKMMIAMNGKTIAYKYINDYYHPFYAADSVSPESKGLRRTKLGIRVQDLLCNLRLMDWGLVNFIAFTGPVEKSLLEDLRSQGFQIKQLPLNPYL
jgi:ubiquinone/menaquinone biosynthesis C-methylase UbiE